jgi:hypothetical protein
MDDDWKTFRGEAEAISWHIKKRWAHIVKVEDLHDAKTLSVGFEPTLGKRSRF